MSLSHRLTRMTGRDPEESHRAATPLELLFDLTFVVAFSQISSQAAHALELGHKPGEAEAADTLTQTQRRVAVLARDGMRNREIADLLGVSVKAVEWHLSHVYRKLGIRSRNDLGTALGS